MGDDILDSRVPVVARAEGSTEKVEQCAIEAFCGAVRLRVIRGRKPMFYSVATQQAIY